jgi:PAS domain S-box-containing protein
MNLREFRRILQLTLLLPLLLLLLLALALAWQIERTLGEQQRIDHNDQIAARLNEMQRLVVDEDSSLHGYQLTQDPIALEPFHAAAAPLASQITQLAELVENDPDQQRHLQQFRDSHGQWMDLANQIVKDVQSSGPEKKTYLQSGSLQSGSLDQAQEEKRLIQSVLGEVSGMTQLEATRRHQEVATTAASVRMLMVVLLLSSVGVGIFLGIWTKRNLRNVSHAFRSSLDEAHQRANELFEKEQWLQTTLESMGDAVIACQKDGRIEFMNPLAQQLTGWSFAEADGKPIREVLSILDEKTREPALNTAEALEAETIVAGLADRSLLLVSNGGEYAIDLSAAPIRAATGLVAGVVVVFRDVTEHRQTEAALLANEKLAVAGRLAASIAHEIHNPLDSVANLHYLIQHEDDPLEQRRYLGLAQQELGRTLQISRAMLGLYRESRAPVDVNLRELLESVLLLLDRRIKDQAIVIERSLNTDARVEGFPGELRQVFANLITNAAEAAGHGGRLSVRLEAAPATHGRSGAIVVIADSGAGIPEDLDGKLFQPFFTTKGEQGTGLGLWVSRGIVEKHGGTLQLTNSTDGRFMGAAVHVYLPAYASARAAAASPTAKAG